MQDGSHCKLVKYRSDIHSLEIMDNTNHSPPDELLQAINSPNLDERLTAIEILGEIGDEETLQALRNRLTPVNRELSALIVAVGKLKRKLGLK